MHRVTRWGWALLFGALFPACTVARGASAPVRHGAQRVYVVKKGDTLYGIARRHGVSCSALARRNNISAPQRLAVGRHLVLPSAFASTIKTGPPRPGPPARAKAAPVVMTPPVRTAAALRWPVRGILTSTFGKRAGRLHDGIDIGAPHGAQVQAAADGEVVFADRHGGYGNMVIVAHDGNLMTIYAHHDRNLVRLGQKVRGGEVIARVGTTGRTTGPHLHFEVRRGTRPEDPLRYLAR